MKIAIASDHAGYHYKEAVKSHLAALGHEVVDFGAFSDEMSDYPDFIRPAAQAVADGRCERGVVLGGSGNGEAITANKIRGIRCAVCWNVESATLAKQHNDANILSIGERMMPVETAIAAVDAWLGATFAGGRHLRRIQKIEAD
jgi:ribose 5-phosphate isomerase B